MAAPVNDSRYSAGSAIRRIGIPHWTRRRRSTQSRGERGARKRERKREREAISRRKLTLSLPELLAAFGIRGEQDPPAQTQSNFINHAG